MKAPALSRGALASTFLRSFTIQGSWNYRTMIGSGFAFALLPVLREVARRRGEPVEEPLRRHVELFNAHPYLAALALGATARLEADGEDPEVVARFKAAIRGPLGGLGDALVWAAWLPATLLGALALAFAGADPVAVVVAFLVIYNAGHLTLRIWGFRTGLDAGKKVGPRLRNAGLGPISTRISRWGAVLLGAVTGLLVTGEAGFPSLWPWAPLVAAAFVAGLRGGHRTWRPAALAVVVLVGLLVILPLIP